MKSKIILITLFVLLAGALSVFFIGDRYAPNTMVLKEEGFYPRELTVELGTTVTFVNKSPHAFWPATDNHPAHDLYEGFDAGRPLRSGESWSFTFDTEGVWTLHDHLRPYFRGRVVVGDVDPETSCIDTIQEDTPLADKQACWERELADSLEIEGADAAFDLFNQLYDAEPDFTAIGCHWMAHKLGEVEYGIYLTHKDLSKLEFPPESSYCGYGYYHGFLEHYLRDNPDYQLADNFCKRLISEVSEDLPRIRLNCYHAIGHGFVPEPIDIEVWGNPKELVGPALDACHNIKEQDALHECLQGTFNVIADWMWNNQFGLYYPEDEPLSVCDLFDDYKVSTACYYEVSMRLNPIVDNSIVGAYHKFISDIPDEKIAGTVVGSVAASALGARILENDFSDLVVECRQLPQFLQKDCIKGLTGAFVAYGDPEFEYVKAIDFCSLNMLTPDEKDTCYWNITRTFKGVYTKDKMARICVGIEEPYQKYCSYDIVYE